QAYPDRAIVLVGPSGPELREKMIENGIMMFTDATRAIAAAGAVATMQARRSTLRMNDGIAAVQASTATKPNIKTIRHEADAKAVLMDYGISVLQERICTNAEQAAIAAKEVGLPVVAKIL